MKRLMLVAAGLAAVVPLAVASPGVTGAATTPQLTALASFDSGSGEAGSEVVSFDALTRTMLVTNGAANRIDIVSLADPTAPALRGSIALSAYGSSVQSVAASRGIGVAVVAGDTVLDPGKAVFFNIAKAQVVSTASTGALPDSVAWNQAGTMVVVANEGEPRCVTGPDRQATTDPLLAENPEGSLTVISVRNNGRTVSARQVGFAEFDQPEQKADLLERGVRVGTWPGSTVAEDLEPEAVSIVGNLAYVTLQENNAYAVVNLSTAKVIKIVPLGLKDHTVTAGVLDASDKDSAFNQQARPVQGMYMADAVAALRVRDRSYLVMANEGDGRAYYSGIDNEEVSGQECFIDESRVRNLAEGLDPAAFGGAGEVDTLRDNANLGRLKVTTTAPSTLGANGYTALASYGGRSVTIRTPAGAVVWDSGSLLEQIVHDEDPTHWDAAAAAAPWATAAYDTRSDDKGPEPEGVAVGEHNGRFYAFVGMERAGGVVVLDVTVPRAPTFVQWARVPGDISPEVLTFVPASVAPGGKPLLLVANEISGTTSVLQLRY